MPRLRVIVHKIAVYSLTSSPKPPDRSLCAYSFAPHHTCAQNDPSSVRMIPLPLQTRTCRRQEPPAQRSWLQCHSGKRSPAYRYIPPTVDFSTVTAIIPESGQKVLAKTRRGVQAMTLPMCANQRIAVFHAQKGRKVRKK